MNQDLPHTRHTRYHSRSSYKETLMQAVLDRGQFLMEEQPKIVRNLLSTDLMVFPSDVRHAQRLHEKIDDAIDYAARFVDMERLNALYYTPDHGLPDAQASIERGYLTLGLYLYFADECSRKNPSTTFLKSLREEGAYLPVEETTFSSSALHDKIERALKRAGIASPTNLAILQDWHEAGRFSIQQEPHFLDPQTGHMQGAYAQLAEAIVQRNHAPTVNGTVVGINEAISYALGNKPHMEHFKNDDQDAAAYAHVKATLDNPERISQHVTQGNTIRRQRVRNIVFGDEQQPPLFSRQEIEASAERQRAGGAFLKKILAYFPEDALELLLRDRQTFTYTNNSDIRGVFPTGSIPGSEDWMSDRSRQSIGARLYRYRTSFFSDGPPDTGFVPDAANTREVQLAQTCLHEMMHIAMDFMTPEEKDDLERRVQRLSPTMQQAGNTPALQERPPSFPQRSLAEVLDYASPDLYGGYVETVDKDYPSIVLSKDTRCDEVVCNLFGMMHADFRGRPLPEEPAVRDLAQAVDQYFHQAVERVRRQQQAAGIALPAMRQGIGI